MMFKARHTCQRVFGVWNCDPYHPRRWVHRTLWERLLDLL
jgi:hypothetical protein